LEQAADQLDYVRSAEGTIMPDTIHDPIIDAGRHGTMTMSVLIIGHSHIQSLTGAAGLLPPSSGLNVQFLNARAAAFQPWASWAEERLVTNPALLAAIEQRIAEVNPDAIAVTIDGSQHFVLGAVNHPRRFDFVLPSRPDLGLDETAELIPYDIVHKMFWHEQSNVLDMLHDIRRCTARPVYYISVPPPLTSFVEAHMPEMRQAISEFGASPPGLRYKLWYLYMDVVRALCAARGVIFLAAPAETLAPGGYLDANFDLDGLHGNTAYAGAVLQQLKAAMQEAAP